MSWFKKLFGIKEQEVVSPGAVEIPKEPERVVWRQCMDCKQPIYEDDKYSKQIGNYYHRRCWKNLVKQAWQN
jgi:hypothetical protein